MVFLLVYIYFLGLYIGKLCNLHGRTFASSKMTAVLGSDKTRNEGNGNEETKMRKWKWEMGNGNGNEEMEMKILNKSIKLKWSFCWYITFF